MVMGSYRTGTEASSWISRLKTQKYVLVADYFLRSLIMVHGKHIMYIQMEDHSILKCVLILV
jgi:hypothetical protein